MTLARQASFDDMGLPLSEVTFCVLDLETTGGSAADCEITEIGAARYRMGDEIGVFQTLVNPGSPIPPFITILTGITQTMVVEAPRIATLWWWDTICASTCRSSGPLPSGWDTRGLTTAPSIRSHWPGGSFGPR